MAPFVDRRVGSRPHVLAVAGFMTTLALVGTAAITFAVRPVHDIQPGGVRSFPLTLAYASLALVGMLAVVGFGLRFRAHGRDLDSWLTLALTLTLFADLHYVLSPVLSSRYVLPGDFSASSPTVFSSSACGGRSARQSSGGRWRTSEHAWRARSMTGWRNISSRSRRTSACSTRALRWPSSCRG